MQPDQTVDLTNCDREPIHIPGSVQPHGCLIACDARAGQVLRHSRNTAEMLGLSGEINGVPLESLIGYEATHTLRNAVASLAVPMAEGMSVAGKGSQSERDPCERDFANSRFCSLAP